MGGWATDGNVLRECWALTWPPDAGPAEGSWAATAAPTWLGREDLSALAAADGVLLVFGGFGEDGKAFADLHVSQNCGDSWDKLKSPGIPARGFAAAAVDHAGRPLLLGGTDEGSRPLKDAWVADVHGVLWYQLPDVPWAARSGAAAVTLANGTVLLMGGMGERDHILQDVWAFEGKEPAAVSPLKPRESLRLVGSTFVDRSVTEVTPKDCARVLAKEVMEQCLSAASLRLPEKSPLRAQLHQKLEASFASSSTEEPVRVYATDSAGMSLLLLEATKRQTRTSGKTSERLAGKLLFVEAQNKETFHKLLALAQSNRLSASSLETSRTP